MWIGFLVLHHVCVCFLGVVEDMEGMKADAKLCDDGEDDTSSVLSSASKSSSSALSSAVLDMVAKVKSDTSVACCKFCFSLKLKTWI